MTTAYAISLSDKSSLNVKRIWVLRGKCIAMHTDGWRSIVDKETNKGTTVSMNNTG